MYDKIFNSKNIEIENIRTVLDIGSTKDNDVRSSNFFARVLSTKCAVTLFSDQAIDIERDLDFSVENALIGDASRIGSETGTFDLVLSSATIEHVGPFQNQSRMISGCIDAANRYVVVTTPNRWHPIEFHTRLPLIHWLPKPAHRFLLKHIGFPFFADENNLNLLDRRALRKLVSMNANRIKECRFVTVRLFGFVSNIVLILEI